MSSQVWPVGFELLRSQNHEEVPDTLAGTGVEEALEAPREFQLPVDLTPSLDCVLPPDPASQLSPGCPSQALASSVWVQGRDVGTEQG